jgi:TIR domain
VDVEDIRGGASDWRASVWAGIDSATVMVFVLTPDSLASSACGEELQWADELNKLKAAARLENWHRWRPARAKPKGCPGIDTVVLP